MLEWLKGRPSAAVSPPAVPPGERIYAIGDVHGRRDLLDALLEAIADDAARDPGLRTTIVLLGDLVDRGPDSAGVIESVIARVDRDWPIRAVMGNHEEVLLEALAGDADALRRLLRFGGMATLESYGVTLDRLEAQATDADGVALVAASIPQRHRDFLMAMVPWIVIGDYLFVHAGVLPGVPLDEQAAHDLRWIRGEFLSYAKPHGLMVVHGHSIREEPDLRSNRIGIDTGAYRTGRLTALALEGTERRILQTEPTDEDAQRRDASA